MGPAARAAGVPELATLDELGMKGYQCYFWVTLFAPAKTPKPIVDTLVGALNKTLGDPAIAKRMVELGFDVTPNTSPEKLAAFLQKEIATWAPIIKASGARLD